MKVISYYCDKFLDAINDIEAQLLLKGIQKPKSLKYSKFKRLALNLEQQMKLQILAVANGVGLLFAEKEEVDKFKESL